MPNALEIKQPRFVAHKCQLLIALLKAHCSQCAMKQAASLCAISKISLSDLGKTAGCS